jgi:uncharacterized protein (DUF362 family)
MKNEIDRREFIRTGIALGAAGVAASLTFPSKLFAGTFLQKPDIAVISGSAYFDNTVRAVELLGGMSAFVPKGSKVGLLVNSATNRTGTFANPDIALAALKMCIDAGASEFSSIENARTTYWKRSGLYGKFRNEVGLVETSDERRTVKIEKGKSLKEAEIITPFLDCDVLINIPIVKNHMGTNFTCTLKNTMGALSRNTCRFFHQQGNGGKISYDDVTFLSQCIADIQLVRTPNLCIVDATEFIITNGPAGPGEIKKAEKIVAGTNNVAVDAYCAGILGLAPSDIAMIRFAHEHGLGEMDLSKSNIREV